MLLPSGSVLQHVIYIIIKMLLPYSSLLIILLNEAGALTNPKGMPLNWCNPLWVTKAVKALSSSVIGTCQYPLEKIKRRKILVLFLFCKKMFRLRHGLGDVYKRQSLDLENPSLRTNAPSKWEYAPARHLHNYQDARSHTAAYSLFYRMRLVH